MNVNVPNNLPQPDYGHFIGRVSEIAQVMRILRPYPHSQHALVTIDGIGGIGKSALALEIAHRYLRKIERIPAEERFQAIIWTSAKRYLLTAEGIVPRKRVTRTLDDIYLAIAKVLERPDIENASGEERADLVDDALKQRRTLLIVDNLETVDDATVMEFLRELPAPTKAIITTRHRLDVAYPIRLVGMPERDARELIEGECKKKLVSLSESNARRLYERTGGVPLAIVWSVAQLAFGYSVETLLKRLGKPYEDISQFCFEEVMRVIRTTTAYELLAILALSEFDLTRDELGDLAEVEDDIVSRDEGLVQLEKLSLVQKVNDKFGLLPLVRQFVLADLSQDPAKEERLEERLATRRITRQPLVIDVSREIVFVEGIPVRLTSVEFRLLTYLYERAGQVCSYDSIIEAVWGAREGVPSVALDQLLSRLRRRIEPDPVHPRFIRLHRGRGLSLTIEPE